MRIDSGGRRARCFALDGRSLEVNHVDAGGGAAGFVAAELASADGLAPQS
jgi:hypothetical protein